MNFLRIFIRYISIGGAMAIGYIVLTATLLELFEWPALLSSITAFFLMLPLAYLGHRNVSFGATGTHVDQVSRFVATMILSFIVSSISIVLIVDVLSRHYAIALMVTTILVPLGNFLLLKNWVFRPVRE